MKRLALVHSKVWRKCRFRMENLNARPAVASPWGRGTAPEERGLWFLH